MGLLDQKFNVWLIGGGVVVLTLLSGFAAPRAASKSGGDPYADLGGGVGGADPTLNAILSSVSKSQDVTSGTRAASGRVTRPPAPPPPKAPPKPPPKPGSPPATGPAYGPGNLPPGAGDLLGLPPPGPINPIQPGGSRPS